LFTTKIPRFTPESFSYLHNPNTPSLNSCARDWIQLLQEGVIQILHLQDSATKVPLLAAVGPLQFESCNIACKVNMAPNRALEPAPWTVVRWLPTDMHPALIEGLQLPTGSRIAVDTDGHEVILFATDWAAELLHANQFKSRFGRSSRPARSLEFKG